MNNEAQWWSLRINTEGAKHENIHSLGSVRVAIISFINRIYINIITSSIELQK
jgi:hypothetical protein